MKHPNGSPVQPAAVIYYAVLSLVCLHLALAYTRLLPVFYSFNAYAQGTAGGVAQTRILMALLFRACLRWQALGHVSHSLATPYNDPLMLVMLAIAAVSVMVASEAVRIAATELGVPGNLARWGAFCVPLMTYFNFVLVSEIRVQDPYDLPQVACFAVALAAILRDKPLVYYGVFLLGTFNKETTCFLIPMYFILRRGRTVPEGVATLSSFFEVLVQSGAWVAIRYFTAHFYSAGTRAVELQHWRSNIRFLIQPLHWPTLASVFAFLWIPFILFFPYIQHKGLRQCAILIPPWLLIMFVAGDLLEIRIHAEWTGYLSICLILIALEALRRNYSCQIETHVSLGKVGITGG